MTPEQNRLRAQIAAQAKNNPADTDTLMDLRRQLKESRLAQHIQLVVDSAPPLTAEQRDRLAVLFSMGGAA